MGNDRRKKCSKTHKRYRDLNSVKRIFFTTETNINYHNSIEIKKKEFKSIDSYSLFKALINKTADRQIILFPYFCIMSYVSNISRFLWFDSTV